MANKKEEKKPLIDKSFFGHMIEALLIGALFSVAAYFGLPYLLLHTGVVDFLIQMNKAASWVIGGIIAIVYFIGREKRDWENATKASAGDPTGYIKLWFRPNNLMDMLGPIIVFVVFCVAFHFLP